MVKKLKYMYIIASIILLSSCSALDGYNGKKSLESAVSSFNTQGTNYLGAKELIKSLEYLKDSEEGKIIFKREYEKAELFTKSIVNKSKLNSSEAEILGTYTYLNEEGKRLKLQGINLDYNNQNYLKYKSKINNLLISYIETENLSSLTRREKINKLSFYKDVLSYNPNVKLANKITKLEKEVILKIKLISRNTGFRRLGRVLEDGLKDYFFRNQNDFKDDYIDLISLNIGSRYSNTEDFNYIVEVDFYRSDVYSDVVERKDVNGRRYYLRRVYVDIDADLNLIEKNTLKRIRRKNFSINKDFLNSSELDWGLSYNNLPFNVENYIESELEDELERNMRYLLRGL